MRWLPGGAGSGGVAARRRQKGELLVPYHEHVFADVVRGVLSPGRVGAQKSANRLRLNAQAAADALAQAALASCCVRVKKNTNCLRQVFCLLLHVQAAADALA